MSAKNRDNHNRWRNKTVAFRVSPEEDEQLERFVKLSGLTKQDYITRRLMCRDVVCRAIQEYTRRSETSLPLSLTSCGGLRVGRA